MDNIERIKTLANVYLMAIAEAKHGSPSGHLYALLAMRLGASLDEHNAAVAALKSVGLVKEESYLLTWAGSEELRQTLVKAATQAEPKERSVA